MIFSRGPFMEVSNGKKLSAGLYIPFNEFDWNKPNEIQRLSTKGFYFQIISDSK